MYYATGWLHSIVYLSGRIIDYRQVHPHEHVTAQLTTVEILPQVSSEPENSFPSKDNFTKDGIPAKLGRAPVNKFDEMLNVFMVAMDSAGRVPVS